ncbi:cytochrome P450 [Luteitalea sp.]|uniref:cytochrome P450 n=1 Tax=Luteitalea sp. TaxID=2004800 RepID=UPI0025C10CCE|nr:cytochrome P450 [Luteitalea sp.]
MSAPIPQWEPLAEPQLVDQRDTYDRMRSACPVARSPRGVTLFRHEDVVAAANDPATYSSATSAYRAVPNSLDPPEHARFRAVIDRFFEPGRIRSLEPRIRTIARAVVDGLPRGVGVDAVTDIGYPFAVRAQAEWLGWDDVEGQLLGWMADNHRATRSAERSRTAAAAAAFDAIVLTQVQHRRQLGCAAPDDPTTELLRMTIDGAPLDDADIVSILRNWTAGDLGSMAAALGVVLHFLATHATVQSALRRGIGDCAEAIDEMLRIDDPFLVNRRVTTVAARVGEFVLAPGTRVYLNWTSANRDETVFGNPDAYRPRENSAHNLVYGTGIHVCPGRPLATMELVVAVQTLLAGTSRIELAADAEALRETYPVGGWRHVPLRLS